MKKISAILEVTLQEWVTKDTKIELESNPLKLVWGRDDIPRTHLESEIENVLVTNGITVDLPTAGNSYGVIVQQLDATSPKKVIDPQSYIIIYNDDTVTIALPSNKKRYVTVSPDWTTFNFLEGPEPSKRKSYSTSNCVVLSRHIKIVDETNRYDYNQDKLERRNSLKEQKITKDVELDVLLFDNWGKDPNQVGSNKDKDVVFLTPFLESGNGSLVESLKAVFESQKYYPKLTNFQNNLFPIVSIDDLTDFLSVDPKSVIGEVISIKSELSSSNPAYGRVVARIKILQSNVDEFINKDLSDIHMRLRINPIASKIIAIDMVY